MKIKCVSTIIYALKLLFYKILDMSNKKDETR